jgi:hypothetical protein
VGGVVAVCGLVAYPGGILMNAERLKKVVESEAPPDGRGNEGTAGRIADTFDGKGKFDQLHGVQFVQAERSRTVDQTMYLKGIGRGIDLGDIPDAGDVVVFIGSDKVWETALFYS